MVAQARDRSGLLVEMLRAEDEEIQAQGWELLGCLSARLRWRIARRLLGPRDARWRLAARCVLPEPLAQLRLQRFAVRCAQYRLERLREAGQEPEDWAWRAVEAAEQRALGRLRERDYDRILRETDAHRDGGWGWDDAWPDLALGDGEVRLDQIPSWWPQVMEQAGASLGEAAAALRCSPEDADIAARLMAHDAWLAAAAAAAGCLVEPHESEDGEWVESIPAAESLEEWRWQRRAWMAIVFGGGDGLTLVYEPPSRQKTL